MRFGANLMKKLFRNMLAELRECNMGLQWGWERAVITYKLQGQGKAQSQKKHEKALQEGTHPMQPMSV